MVTRFTWAWLYAASLLLTHFHFIFTHCASVRNLCVPLACFSRPWAFVIWSQESSPSVNNAGSRDLRCFRSLAKSSGKGGAKSVKKSSFSGTLADRDSLIERSLALGIPREDIDDCLKQFVVIKGGGSKEKPAESSTSGLCSELHIAEGSDKSSDSSAEPNPAEPAKKTLPRRLLRKQKYLPEKGVEYSLYEAIDRIKLISGVRFTEGIDVALHVPLTPKKIRATAGQYAKLITIPYQSLKSRRCRIGVFAKPDICEQVRALNATKIAFVGGAELIDKFKATEEYPEVDFVLSDLATFHKLSAIGRTLGRRGLMPSLTVGTCIQHTQDLLEKVQDVENRNTFILRADRAGDIKCNFADVTMPTEEIRENLLEIVKYLRTNKPFFAGSQLLSAAYVSSSMGPSFRINLRDLGCRSRTKHRLRPLFISYLLAFLKMAEEPADSIPLAQRMGIDRICIDYASTVVPWLTQGKYEKRLRIPRHRDTPLEFNSVRPNFCYSSFTNNYNGVCSNLAHASFNRNKFPIVSLRWFPNGKTLLAGSQGGKLIMWNGLTFQFDDIKRYPVSGGSVTALEWSPDGDYLISGDEYGKLALLSPALSLLDNTLFEGLNKPVLDLSMSQNGSKVCACADTYSPHIWDVQRHELEGILTGAHVDSSSVSCLQWHPTKSLIVTGSKINVVSLWDPSNRRQISTIHAHKAPICKVSWNPDGYSFLTSGVDGLVKLWDLRMMKQLLVYRIASNVPGTSTLNATNPTPPPMKMLTVPTTIGWNPVQRNVFAVCDNKSRMFFFSSHFSEPLVVINLNIADDRDTATLAMDWHPMGHLLATCSDDRIVRFWSRPHPGGLNKQQQDAKEFGDIEFVKSFPLTRFQLDGKLDISSFTSVNR
ncbi:Polyadenylation factor subunit 2 [Babesia sp. Xinjiang]|uniref:Polyadenylation factor subunit 2 n=1 Tax=Babesia sp. Xinjiang TaxID=462227 RepID=UPI000A2635D6|nr:Polyadenylation factor subunit 2 [Babesia sp. Xinjiang]ORM39550.1 Polyadenylation factor subunit 2 [Babesia sp. Xinjiang]